MLIDRSLRPPQSLYGQYMYTGCKEKSNPRCPRVSHRRGTTASTSHIRSDGTSPPRLPGWRPAEDLAGSPLSSRSAPDDLPCLLPVSTRGHANKRTTGRSDLNSDPTGFPSPQSRVPVHERTKAAMFHVGFIGLYSHVYNRGL